MITEGLIESVDFSTTTCRVRIPLFETVQATAPFVLLARIAVQPGVCNSYIAGDPVWVAFEQDRVHRPVVIGKIFQSADQTLAKSRGIYQVESFKCTNSAELPADTHLSGGITGYDTLQKIASAVQFLDMATSGKVSGQILSSRYLTKLTINADFTLILETQRSYTLETVNSFLKYLGLSCNSPTNFLPCQSKNTVYQGCYAKLNETTGLYELYLVGSDWEDIPGTYQITALQSIEITQI